MITVLKNHSTLADLKIDFFPNQVIFEGKVFTGHAMNENGDALYRSKDSSTLLFIYKK